MGRIIAFGGRLLEDGQPKYINSPETPVYTKGRHLFGLNLAKTTHEKTLVVVEGYMDAIALHQAGVNNAVASLGTALTDNQAQMLRKYTESVIIAYDSDAAGQAAAMRSLDILGAKGIKVTVLQVPDGKDPDDFIRRNGPERFHALLEKALPLLDFKLLAARRAHTRDGQLDILEYQDAACQILAREDNAIVRELYCVKLAEELNTAADTVQREVERRYQNPDESPQKDQLRRRLQTRVAAENPVTLADGDSATREEIYLLSLLAADSDLLGKLTPPPGRDDFSEGTMQEIAETALQLAAAKKLDTAVLVALGENHVVRGQPLHELLARSCMKLDVTFGSQDLEKAATEQLRRQRRHRLRYRCECLKNDLACEGDEGRQCDLKDKLRNLTRQLIELKHGNEEIQGGQ